MIFLSLLAARSFASDTLVIKRCLTPGWNLVSFPLDSSQTIDSALSSIWDKVEIVKDMDDAYVTRRDSAFNTLRTIVPGHGYFVKVSDSCTLAWNLPRPEKNCFEVQFPTAIAPGLPSFKTFKPKITACCCYLETYSLDIYDTWGNRLFHTDNPLTGWDGTSNGALLKTDSYIWKVNYTTTAGSYQKLGNVVLIR